MALLLTVYSYKWTDEIKAKEINWSEMAIASTGGDKPCKYIVLKDDDGKEIALIEVDAGVISYIVRAFCASHLDDCKKNIKGFFQKLKNK